MKGKKQKKVKDIRVNVKFAFLKFILTQFTDEKRRLTVWQYY
jgi:hypothetical protein